MDDHDEDHVVQPEPRRRRRRVRPQADPLPGHAYLQFEPATEAYMRCDRLRTMEMDGHPAIDWEILATLGEEQRARGIIGFDTPWDRLFTGAYQPTLRAISVEFMSSFTFTPRPDDMPEEDDDPEDPFFEVSFRLRGQWHRMSLRRFAVVSGLYTEEETFTPLYTEGITELTPGQCLGFWSVISAGPFPWPTGKASAITDPLYRYLHRLIATSIAPRKESRDRVTTTDLFYLYCLLTGRPCALATCLAQFYGSAYHRQEWGLLYGGSYITSIARHLTDGAVDDDPLCGPIIEPTRLGRSTLFGMHIVREFPGVGLRFRDNEHQIFVPQPLPEVIPVLPEDQPIQAEPVLEANPPPQAAPQPAPPHPPQYPIHVVPGVLPLLQDIKRQMNRMEYMHQWALEEMAMVRAATGLPPRPFVLPPHLHPDPVPQPDQQQQDMD